MMKGNAGAMCSFRAWHGGARVMCGVVAPFLLLVLGLHWLQDPVVARLTGDWNGPEALHMLRACPMHTRYHLSVHTATMASSSISAFASMNVSSTSAASSSASALQAGNGGVSEPDGDLHAPSS